MARVLSYLQTFGSARRVRSARRGLSRFLGLIVEQGDDEIRWRTRIDWRLPRLTREYTKYPKFEKVPDRPAEEHDAAKRNSEHQHAQTEKLKNRRC